MRYIHYILLIISFWSVSAYSNAQNYREAIKQTHTFKINASGTLEVVNKYGSIYVDVWDNDSVKIDIDFVISEKNENRFNKTKSNVTFDLSGNSLYRSVKTLYGSSYSSLFKDLKEATNLLSSNQEQTHVDYYLTIPNYINVKIENKYGNVILPTLNGDVSINLVNGDFQAKNLNGNSRLNLSFGNTLVNHIEQGVLALNFMQTNIGYADNITLDAKSSNVSIQNLNLLKLDARRGKIIIEKANYIFGDAEFCELSINNLLDEISLNLKYGILKKLSLSDSYNKIKIKSDYADININAPDKSFTITTCNENEAFKSDRNIIWTDKQRIKDNNSEKNSGYYKEETSAREISIEISNAEIQIN